MLVRAAAFYTTEIRPLPVRSEDEGAKSGTFTIRGRRDHHRSGHVPEQRRTLRLVEIDAQRADLGAGDQHRPVAARLDVARGDVEGREEAETRRVHRKGF